ncbi:O-antigen ligase family protein, partial [Candidatus Calescamantes bacterium]|nr:O-antigen ligase family protein [Candidatus Calescamantes bacterium]
LDFFSLPPFLWEKFKEFPPQVWVSIGNSNMVGEFIVLLLPFAFLFPRYILFLPITALVLTFSKGCILGVLASFLLFYKKKKILLILLVVTTLFLLISIRFTPFQDLLTFQGRREVWRISWKMLKERPLTGWGWGSYRYYLPFFKDATFNKILPNVNIQQAHNDYLQIWIEGGIISLLAFIFLLFKIMQLNIKRVWFIGGMALLLEALVSFPFYTPLSSLLFFSLSGLEGKREGLKVKIHPLLLGMLLLPLLIYFLLFPFIAHLQFRAGNRLSMENRFSSSLPYYHRSIILDPSSELSYVNLGFAYYRLGNGEKARELWEKALRINPTSRPALLNLKTYYRKSQKRRQEEKIDLKKLGE